LLDLVGPGETGVCVRTVGRFVAPQVVILLLGAGLVWVTAAPLAADGSGLGSIDWDWPLGYAVFWGLVAGAIEGLVLGRDRLVGAIVVAALVAPVALWVPLLLVSELVPTATDVPTEPADLAVAMVGWGTFGLTSVLAASALGTVLRRTTYSSSEHAPRRVAMAAVVVIVAAIIIWLAALS
jgi:hypothetical protein